MRKRRKGGATLGRMDPLCQGVRAKMLGVVSRVDEPALAPVHHLPPLVRADPPVAFEVWASRNREWWPPGPATA